jgi:hypothetical protein
LAVYFDLGSGTTYQAAAGGWTAGNYVAAPGAAQLVAMNGQPNLAISGVQLERGSVATPFERRHIALETTLCQRYYWQDTFTNLVYNALAGTAIISGYVKFPVTMRANPTITYQTGTNNQVDLTVSHMTFWQSVATGGWLNPGLVTAAAEL